MIWQLGAETYSSSGHKTSLMCKTPCWLALPPARLEWPALRPVSPCPPGAQTVIGAVTEHGCGMAEGGAGEVEGRGEMRPGEVGSPVREAREEGRGSLSRGQGAQVSGGPRPREMTSRVGGGKGRLRGGGLESPWGSGHFSGVSSRVPGPTALCLRKSPWHSSVPLGQAGGRPRKVAAPRGRHLDTDGSVRGGEAMCMGNPLPALSCRLLLLCPPVAFRAHLESLLFQEALPSLESLIITRM